MDSQGRRLTINGHNDSNPIEGSCKRCGTCCSSGGPALHREDIDLVMDGRLLPVQLITYRKGEPAWHPLKREMIALPCEMIKIRSVPGDRACMLYNSADAACSIYDHRPIECRALKCWDTSEVEELFLKDLLSRADLFRKAGTLQQLVDAYEKAIPVEDILFFCNAAASGSSEDRARAHEHMELVAKVDSQFRKQAGDTLGIDPDDLLFYFGSTAKDIFQRVMELQEKTT